MSLEQREIDEKRRYYRLRDSVALKYRILTDEELARTLGRMEIGQPDLLSLASSFAAASGNMQRSFERFRHRSPDIASYLDGLNAKLDQLIQLLVANEGEFGDEPTHDVILSGSGVSIHSAIPIPVGAKLEIKLLMFPSYSCVLAFGKVVRCVMNTNGSQVGQTFDVAVDFTHIRESDRDLIVRHVNQKQTLELRNSRTSQKSD